MTLEKTVSAGNLALVRGLYEEAKRHFAEAQESCRAFAERDPVWAEIHRGLAQVYLAAGNFEEASKAARVALDTDQEYWGPDYSHLADSLFLLGEALRKQGDFERSRPAFERALALRQAAFGETHEQTLQILSRLVILHLQAGWTHGLEDLHKQALRAYQACFPTGQWTNFLHLQELISTCCEAGNIRQAENILKVESGILSKLLGSHHREVASVLHLQADLLKQEKRHLASWQVNTRSVKLENESNEQLFLSEQRNYCVPMADCRSVIERMLSAHGSSSANAPTVLRNAWWRVDSRAATPTELVATLRYSDEPARNVSADPTNGVQLRLTIRLSNRVFQTHVDYDCTLANSDRMTLAIDIVKFTLEEIDQTLAIVPTRLPTPTLAATSINYARPSDRAWPTAQQFNEAIQNPGQTLGPLELRQATAETNVLGLPRPCSGALGTVYRLRATAGDWAVKCFTEAITDQEVRYRAIAARLESAKLPYFMPFHYASEGIKINDVWFPIVQMEWADAAALNVYIADHLQEPAVLRSLMDKIVAITNALQANGIAHGDLQHGNMLVRNGELILVDYDGMWVPELSHLQSNELGHRNFQHPGRSKEHYGAYLDNFAAWLIYCSINCLVHDPQLWEALQGGDDCLLLRRDDLAHPATSVRFKRLRRHENNEVCKAAELIAKLLAVPVDRVPPFAALLAPEA